MSRGLRGGLGSGGRIGGRRSEYLGVGGGVVGLGSGEGSLAWEWVREREGYGLMPGWVLGMVVVMGWWFTDGGLVDKRTGGVAFGGKGCGFQLFFNLCPCPAISSLKVFPVRVQKGEIPLPSPGWVPLNMVILWEGQRKHASIGSMTSVGHFFCNGPLQPHATTKRASVTSRW